MPRTRKTPHLGDPLYLLDPNPRDVNANMRGSPFPLQGPPGWYPEEGLPGWHPEEEGPPGWHHGEDTPPGRYPGEAAPHECQVHPRGDEFDSLKSVGAPRMRGSINEPRFLPNPNHFPRNPPGFDNSFQGSRFPPNPSHFPIAPRNPPGFDKSNSFHGGKTVLQESLEITSDRPFLPQRRAPPAGSNPSSPSDRVPRGDSVGTRVELRGPSLSVAADDSNAQETSEGGLSESFRGKMRKKKPRIAKDAEPAHAGLPLSGNLSISVVSDS